MGRGKNNKDKLNKLAVMGMLFTLTFTDIAPLVSLATTIDTIGIQKGVEIGELEIQEVGELEDEDVEDLELQEMKVEEDTELKLQEDGVLKEANVTNQEPVTNEEDTQQPQAMSLMRNQTEPNYVMATDSDFKFKPTVQNGYYVNGKQGYFEYIGDDEYVEIPDVIHGHTITSYQQMFRSSKQNLKGVKASNPRVTSTRWMFTVSESKTLDLTQLDTSRITDMYGMFLNAKMEELDLSNFDTSRATTMHIMFMNTQVKNLDLTSFDTSRVGSMVGMFENVRSETIDMSSFDTRNVTNMNRMFYGVTTKNIDVRTFNTASVWDMSSMFESTHGEIQGLEGFNTGRVTNMSSMFRVSRAKRLDLSSFNTKNVVTMERMFEGATVADLNIKSFDTSRVTTMARMFYNFKSIPNLDLSNFNTSKVTNMSEMFELFGGTIVNLSSFDTTNTTNMSEMFKGSSIQNLVLTMFNTSNTTNMRGMFQDTLAVNIDLSSFNTYRITDMTNMFNNARAKSVKLNNFDTSYVTDMTNMFKDTKMTSIDLSSFDLSSINIATNMFQGTSIKEGLARSLSDANILNNSSNKPSGLTFTPKYHMATDEDFIGTTNGSFRYTGNDLHVEIPHTIRGVKVTSYRNMFDGTTVQGVISTNPNVTDMSNMFINNTATELNVGTMNTTNVTNMSGMFQNTKTIQLDLKNFLTGNVTNMENMFRNTAVRDIDLGSFDLTKVTNTNNMFQNTKATVGYARTQEELVKLNSSTNKPMGLTFTIWSSVTTQTPVDWTNGNVDITIHAISDKVGIDFVERINEPGRNLLIDSGKEVGLNGVSEFLQVADLAPIFDKYGVDQTYSVSFDLRTKSAKAPTSMNVYMQNGSSTKYQFVSGSMVITNEYKRFKYEGLTPRISTAGDTKAMMAFYGTYGSGNYPVVKNVKIEFGDKATPWTPAPEDSSSGDEKSNIYTVYDNGTYIFRVTDLDGSIRTVAHTVTNIDRTIPTAEITPSTSGMTAQDVTLYIEADDDKSGVRSITLPDGKIVNGNKAEFIAKDNKEYTFKVTDNAGNVTEVSDKVSNIDRSLIKLAVDTENSEGWTREPVIIKITSEDSATPLKDIKMVNSPIKGRNLIKGSKNTWTNIHMPASRYYTRQGTDIYLEKGKTYTYGINVEKTSNDNVIIISEIGQGGLGVDYGVDIRPETGGGMLAVNLDGTRTERTFSRLDGNKYEYFSWGLRNNLKETSVRYKDVKLEEGTKATPWTPAPEDIKLVGNSKTFPVVANGIYTFQASYNNGATSDVSVNVTNIDLDAPTITVENNPTEWTEDEEVKLNIKATDTQSGFKTLTLPDGTITTEDNITYTVTENGDYKFIVEDNLGNTSEEVITVNRIMVEYYIYTKDSEGKPIQGSEFELLRDGITHTTAISDSEGLVHFGKVPTEGVYSVRQTKAPEGGIVNPEEIPVLNLGESIEVVTYKRGEEMPATGTLGNLLTFTTTMGVVGALITIRKRKNKTIGN